MNGALSQRIDSIVADAIGQRIFPGAVVLIAHGARVLHQAAYGDTMYAAPGSVPVQLDTIYDVASLTKMFTATAVLCLSDAGQLNLHAPVARYLPEFQAAQVTLWHLLTHTSGLDIRLSTWRQAGRAGLLDAVYRSAPVEPPGTCVAYTNVNSLLLGEVVARCTGKPFQEALQELVISPMGLRDTLFCPPASLLPRIAPTEIDTAWRGGLVHGSVHDESTHALGGVAGHAGLFSTAADLLRFCQSWLSAAAVPQLLRPETIAVACANQTAGLNSACGLGWMLDRANFMGAAPAGTFGHTGFTGPAMVVVPKRQLCVIVLSNRVYPQRRGFEHHPVTAAIVQAALAENQEAALAEMHKLS